MKKPKVLASAKFTKDMVESLETYFDQYAVDGVIGIEVTDQGLWWENPNGSRQFLGSSTLLDQDGHSKRLN